MRIEDLELSDLESIQPVEVESVLRSLGWEPSGGVPNLASQWLKQDEPNEPSVMVPLDRTLGDYRRRMIEALRELERIHGEQGDQLIVQLLLPGVDEVVNQKEESTIAGSIPWTAGENQITGFREILVASAKAAEVKERRYGTKRWTTARRYLSQVRMGQTRIGSYVVTALSPVGPIPIVDQKEQYGETLGLTGRDVVQTLTHSLETLRASTDEFKAKRNEEVFEEAVDEGVSLDLVKAVQKNLGDAESAATTIQWSSRIRTPERSAEIVFDRSHVAALATAATRLTEVVQSKQATIIGRVTGLNRQRPGRDGTVVLNVLDGTDKSIEFVSLVLGENYDEAIRYHRSGDLVRASGRLDRAGRGWELTDVTSLEVLSSQEIGPLHLHADRSHDEAESD
jgi:hypothetical protein